MLELLKEECNVTLTENGAVTPKTSGSACLDLFGTIGALRFADEENIINRFSKAYIEDKETAMKIVFYARDVRSGLGERRVFRVIMKWLAENHPESVLKNLQYIHEYGRYDDYMCLMDTLCEKKTVELIKAQLLQDVEGMNQNNQVSLLAKWLPSLTSSNKEKARLSRKLAKMMGMKEKEYRQTLSKLRNYLDIVEIHLNNNDFTFDYSHIPSKAMLKYQNAFLNKDNLRYLEFLNAVNSGKATMNTGTIAPYEVIKPLINFYNWGAIEQISAEERQSINTIWNQLMDFTVNENALAVIDGSGSMYGNNNGYPIMVALSLGIYFAQNTRGAFHNHFITFSEKPQLVELKGNDIVDKVQHCASYCEVANTNLERVFDLILNAAVKNNVPQAEMPDKLYIISDMEFDSCMHNASVSNFEAAKSKFEVAGYILPKLVFWNVASRRTQQPVKMHDSGTALVSGCSTRIFSMVMNDDMDPYRFMREVISSERYKVITA